jgi:hypothetical protein
LNEEYVNALKDVVITFLNFSNEWLEDDVIDKETYIEITKNKRKFVEGTEIKQG